MDRGPLLVPNPIVIGAFHAEDIITGRQIGIIDATLRTSVDPILIQPLQHIGILVLLWNGVIQGREFEGYEVVDIRERKLFAWWQLSVNSLVELAEGRDYDRGNVLIVSDLLRIEDVNTIDPTK